jgi:hypothetical protein
MALRSACLGAAAAVALLSCGETFTSRTGGGVSAGGGAASSTAASSQASGGGNDGGAGGEASCPGADLESDPQNCGACFHDCLGGSCQGGACQPVVLVGGLTQPIGVAIAGGDLYFSHASQIERIELAAGASAEPYLTAGSRVGYLTIRAGSLFWPDQAQIHVTELATKQDTFTTSPLFTPLGIAASEAFIAWTEFNAGHVRAISTTSPFPVTQIANGVPSPEDVAYGPGGELFWSVNGGTEIMRYSAGSKSTFADAQQKPAGLACDGTFLYWGTQTDGAIWRKALTGGAIEQLATSGEPTGIAVSDAVVAWADYYDGTVTVLVRPAP